MTASDLSAAPEAPAPEPTPVWEDFVDVLGAPAQVFARRADGRFGVALLALTALFALIFFATKPLMQPIFDRGFEQAVEAMRARGMSETQIAAARPMTERLANFSINASGVVGLPLVVTFGALIAWLCGKLFGSRARFGQMMMVATYANVPRILGAVVGAAILFFVDASRLPPLQQMSVGPALLLDREASLPLVSLLGRLDVFTLWSAALYGIGTAVVGRVSRRAGLGAAAVGFAVATLFALRQAQ
jgi:hypothetical protein